MKNQTTVLLLASLSLFSSCSSRNSTKPAPVKTVESAAFYTGEIWVAPGSSVIENGRTIYLDGHQSRRGSDAFNQLNRKSLTQLYGDRFDKKTTQSRGRTYKIVQ